MANLNLINLRSILHSGTLSALMEYCSTSGLHLALLPVLGTVDGTPARSHDDTLVASTTMYSAPVLALLAFHAIWSA